MTAQGWTDLSAQRARVGSQWPFISVIVAFAVLSRFLFLQHHQINHDESIYILDSLKYMKEGYRFDPDQHGPFLFFLNMVIFRLFGASDSTILIGPATLGVILVILPLLLRKVAGIDSRGIIIASAVLAASPSFLYFSRMLKNDIYVATFVVGIIVFGIRYGVSRRPSDACLDAAFLALLFATRIDAIFQTAVFVAFLGICWLTTGRATQDRVRPDGRWSSARTVVPPLAVFVLLYLFFYSLYPGALMGFRDNSLALLRFWWNRHQQHLLPGPATYYFDLMFQYELPVLVIFFLGLRRHLESTQRSRFVFRGAFLAFASLCLYGDLTLPVFATYLHAGTLREVSYLAYWAFLGGWATVVFLRKRQTLYAFLVFWGASSNVFYAFAGEKQPQIVLFPLLPLILIVGPFLSEFIEATDFGRRRPIHAAICGAGFAFYVYTALIVAFATHYFPSERLSNAATSPEIKDLRNLLAVKSKETGLDEAMPIKFMFSFSSDTLAWYLRDFTSRLYSHDLEQFYPVIVFYNHKRYEYRSVLATHYDHYKIHTNLGTGYVRSLQWWPLERFIDSLHRELSFQIFRWRYVPVGAAYIDVYVQKRDAAITPDDTARLALINRTYARRVLPVVAHFGSPGSLLRELRSAGDMAIDSVMNVYVADTLNRRVMKYSRNGTPLLAIRDVSDHFAPEGLGLCEESGRLYVTVPSLNQVREYTLGGSLLRSLPYQFVRPMDAACDGTGSVLVIDNSPKKLLRFDRAGEAVGEFGEAGRLLQSPVSVTIHKPTGEILIADMSQRKVVKLDRGGRHLVSFDLPGISEAQWQLYGDLDAAGNFFVPDLSNSRVIVLDRSHVPVLVLGEESRGYGGILAPLSVALRERTLYVYSRSLERITGYDLAGLPLYQGTSVRR
jgi:uncharacterized protein (TIGR03663 family)